jgi:ABC-type glycerol-3-phosphate transport system permease component
MSQQLVICLIAVAANLAGMLVIYAALSNAVARSRTLATVALILSSQLFWMVPAIWLVETAGDLQPGAYVLWLGNWLVSGFSLLLFANSASRIPASLGETAQMDGLGGFGAWQQTVLPFVRRDLVFMGIFTVMATLLPFWGCLVLPEAGNSIVFYQRFLSPAGRVAFMAAMSIAGALALVPIFFLAKRT